MRFQKVLIKDFRRLPIPAPAAPGGGRYPLVLQIGEAASLMTALMLRLDDSRIAEERNHLQREAARLDTLIDRLVYDLHGLTPEEVVMVEASTEPH